MVRFLPRFEDLFGDGWPSSLVRQWSVEEANSRNVISDHVREIVPSSVPSSWKTRLVDESVTDGNGGP